MHIAMLAPITWRVPPRAYGPREQVVWALTEGLIARGVEVTLFASADSRSAARLVGTCPLPLAEAPALDRRAWEPLHLAAAFERAARFDLIHSHAGAAALAYSRLTPTPVLGTIGRPSAGELPLYQAYNGHVAYVAPSDAERSPALDYLATVYHGVDLAQFPPRERPGDYLLFLGRIHPDKGAAEAIEVARRAGRRLLLAGPVQHEPYFRERVAPLLDGERARFLGAVAPGQRAELLGGALALLQLSGRAAPSGLGVAEAMACGTPVIAFGQGAAPELLRHGESGFIVETLDEAAGAARAAARLDRRAIARYAEARFGQARMVDDYLRLYHSLLDSRPLRELTLAG